MSKGTRQAHAGRLADVSLVIGLDSGIADTDHLWLTTSLRGAVVATVTVTVAEAAVHSGIAGGIIPEPFRILRQLLDRIEDSTTGVFVLPELNAPSRPNAGPRPRPWLPCTRESPRDSRCAHVRSPTAIPS